MLERRVAKVGAEHGVARDRDGWKDVPADTFQVLVQGFAIQVEG